MARKTLYQRTRGYKPDEEDQKIMVVGSALKWGQMIDKGDPYYNANLSLIYEDLRIKI